MTVEKALKILESVPDKQTELMMLVRGGLVPAAISQALVDAEGRDVDFIMVEEEPRE